MYNYPVGAQNTKRPNRYLLNRRLAGLGHHHEPNWPPSQLSNDVIDPGRIFFQVLHRKPTKSTTDVSILLFTWCHLPLLTSVTRFSFSLLIHRQTAENGRKPSVHESYRPMPMPTPTLSLSLAHTHTDTHTHNGPWHTEQRIFLFLLFSLPCSDWSLLILDATTIHLINDLRALCVELKYWIP